MGKEQNNNLGQKMMGKQLYGYLSEESIDI